MNIVYNAFLKLWARFRYPFSTPEDVAKDIGLPITNLISFPDFMNYLIEPSHRPSNLTRLMSKKDAENVFRSAKRKECFQQNSLFSYYFNGTWLEFILEFDDNSQLRRLYLRHKDLKRAHEISISS